MSEFDCFDTGDPFVRGHIARALYDRLRVSDTNPLVLPKGFHINCPVIGHTTVGRMVLGTEKSTAVTMSWFRGAPRVDVIDGTAGHLLDEHAYVSFFVQLFTYTNIGRQIFNKILLQMSFEWRFDLIVA